MKKFLSVLLVATLAVGCLAGCGGDGRTDNDNSEGDYAVAMVTDYGDVTDQSFNQTTYEACKVFCEENSIDFKYYKPSADTTAERVASVESAIDDGYNVIVMPGYAFGATIVEVAEDYPDVKFIAIDVSKADMLESAVANAGEQYDYNPDNWELEDYVSLDNVYCAIYQEEISGFMAGYAAVKMGYRNLGFLGGMAMPAVMRYGYGFVQGAEKAAQELDVDVTVKYAYGNQFIGDADITAAMDTWYRNGMEVVFACGGGIYTSVAEAAVKVGGKLIGVDTDQAVNIDGDYGEGLTLTSAMKGLYPTTYDTLTDVLVNGNWDAYAGKIATLGLVSEQEVEANYVQLPLETTQWNATFSIEDYKTLVKDIYNNTIKVSNDISEQPTVEKIKVEWLGNLK